MLIDPEDLQFANMVIARRIQSLRRSGAIQKGEEEDFAADITVYLLSVWDRFDPQRGTREAFINTVVTTHSVSLLRKRKAKKRGGSRPTGDADPSECPDPRTDGDAAERHSDLKADLEGVMEHLSPMQQRLVNRLMRCRQTGGRRARHAPEHPAWPLPPYAGHLQGRRAGGLPVNAAATLPPVRVDVLRSQSMTTHDLRAGDLYRIEFNPGTDIGSIDAAPGDSGCRVPARAGGGSARDRLRDRRRCRGGRAGRRGALGIAVARVCGDVFP